MGTGGPRRARGLLTLALVAGLTVTGCQYLLGFDPSDPAFTDDFANPSPLATFGQGRATVTIEGEPPVVLDRLAAPGSVYKDLGSDATFTNADGWYVRVSGATPGASPFGLGGWIQLDRLTGGQHWTTSDPSRCVLTVVRADATGLRGTATCKGLRWSDALVTSFGSLESAYVAGQPPFDAEISFEASPEASQPG
jgi:hypothetical protein